MRVTLKGGGGLFRRTAAEGTPARAGGGSLGNRNALLLGAAIAVLGGMLWYFYLYTPTTLRITELEGSVQGLETQVALGRAARANLPALRAEVAALERERDLFLAQLPEQNEVAELLDQLRGAAGAAGVVFSALQNTGPVAEEVQGVRLLGFSLATQGTYSQTIDFLRTLEALPRFTKVRRVGLTAGEAGSDPVLSASYDFTVYVYTGLGTGETGTGEAGTGEAGTVDPATGETLP